MRRVKEKKQFTYSWAFEDFQSHPTFFEKRMFGGLSAYLHGRLVMVLVEDPGDRSYRGKTYRFDIWNGIMFPTEKAHHESLMKEFPDLMPHPVLGKWLYLGAPSENFETTARELASRILQDDRRLGIWLEIKEKKKRGTAPRRIFSRESSRKPNRPG